MVRIRYTRASENQITSKSYHGLERVWRASIAKNEDGVFEYKVDGFENDQWTTRFLGKTKNLTVAKNKAKQLLKSLGVMFKEEVRRKD